MGKVMRVMMFQLSGFCFRASQCMVLGLGLCSLDLGPCWIQFYIFVIIKPY